jgi:hypothetical protein
MLFKQCSRCKCWVLCAGLAGVSAWSAVEGHHSCNEVQRRMHSDTICELFVAEPTHGHHKDRRSPSSPMTTYTTSVSSATTWWWDVSGGSDKMR